MIGGTEGRQLDARQGAVGWHLHTAGVARQTESAMYQRILVPVDGIVRIATVPVLLVRSTSGATPVAAADLGTAATEPAATITA